MGISNDWQNIDGLTYKSISDEQSSHPASWNYIWTRESAQIFADAIGWEVVPASDYGEHLTAGELTYDANEFYFVRPVDTEDYNIGMFYANPIYLSTSNTADYGFVFVTLSTLTVNNSIYSNGQPTQWMLLRPTAQGGVFVRINNDYAFGIDKFYNPKSGLTKIGVFNASGSSGFVDMWTGLYISYNYSASTNYAFLSQNKDFSFVALKKLTQIDANGVYNATTIYRAYVDYSNSDKTIELGGVMYRAIKGHIVPYYIPLA